MATYQPHPTAAYRVIDNHVFVITPDSRQHELNGEVELLVWRLCEEKARSLTELTQAVTKSFKIDEGTARDDLEHFLAEMTNAGVLAREL